MNLEGPSFDELVARILNSVHPDPVAKKPRPRRLRDPWEELARIAQSDIEAVEELCIRLEGRPWGPFIIPYLIQFRSVLAFIRDAARHRDPVVKDLIDELGGDSRG